MATFNTDINLKGQLKKVGGAVTDVFMTDGSTQNLNNAISTNPIVSSLVDGVKLLFNTDTTTTPTGNLAYLVGVQIGYDWVGATPTNTITYSNLKLANGSAAPSIVIPKTQYDGATKVLLEYNFGTNAWQAVYITKQAGPIGPVGNSAVSVYAKNTDPINAPTFDNTQIVQTGWTLAVPSPINPNEYLWRSDGVKDNTGTLVGTMSLPYNMKGPKGDVGGSLYTYSVTAAPNSNPFQGITFKDGEWANYPNSGSRWMVQWRNGAWDFANQFNTGTFVNTLDFINVPFSNNISVDVTNSNKHKITITDNCTISITNSQPGNIGLVMIEGALYSTVTLTGRSFERSLKSVRDVLEWENINGLIHWKSYSAGDTDDEYVMTSNFNSSDYADNINRDWVRESFLKSGVDISGGVWRSVFGEGYHTRKIKVIQNVPIILTGYGYGSFKFYDKTDTQVGDLSGYVNNWSRTRLPVASYPATAAYMIGVLYPSYPTNGYNDRLAIFYNHRDYVEIPLAADKIIPANSYFKIFENVIGGVDPSLFCFPKQLNIDGIQLTALSYIEDYLRITAYNSTNAAVTIPAGTLLRVKFFHDISS